MFKKSVSHRLYTIKELLDSTHIAPFQRIEDRDHVDTIFTGISKYYEEFKQIFLPNIISLVVVNKDGEDEKKYINKNTKFIVLDGQHRLKALTMLADKYPDTKTIKIRTDVYSVDTIDQAKDIYTIINSSKKVELYTGNLEPYIIPKIQKYFLEHFSQYCKKTQNPRGVNINVEVLGKMIAGYDLISRLGVTLENVDKLLERIHLLNNFYSVQTPERLYQYGIKENLIREVKNKNSTFYLGLFRKYEWIERIIDPKSFDEQEHCIRDKEIKISRKNIPKRVRESVWNKHFETLTGECLCCGKEIKYQDFDCGHIISVKLGGTNDVDNLEPICRVCNIDMGTMNLYKYRELFTR